MPLDIASCNDCNGRHFGVSPMIRGLVVMALIAYAANAPAHAEATLPRLDFAGSATWIGQVPVLLAIDKGFYRDVGLDVQLQPIVNSSDRLRALSAGSVAFSNIGRTTVIADMARGNTSFYFFANIDDSPGNEGCFARPGFASMQALRGRKVAANTSAQITLSGLLEKAGMTEKDVSYVNLPPTEMAPALANGNVDAACVWQPLLDGLQKAAPGGRLLGTDRDTPNFARFGTMSAPDILVIGRALVKDHPDQAAKIASATFRGADYATSHPEETAAVVAHYFRQSPEQVLASMSQFKFAGGANWPDHMQRHAAQMQYLADWLQENGKTPNKVDVSQWLNTSFIARP